MSKKDNKNKKNDKDDKKKGAGKNRPAGWGKKSHGNDVEPNYDVVFPRDAVNTMTIVIAPDDWAAMQADLEDIKADSRPVREAVLAAGGLVLSPEERTAIAQQYYMRKAEEAAKAQAEAPPAAAEAQSPPAPAPLTTPYTGVKIPQVDSIGFSHKRKPMWVPATIRFGDREWTRVGIRYKGASSLGAWAIAEMRLPFKLKFDQYEDDHPEIRNQRFFGFRELSLANNHKDAAGMRDTLVYDLLRAAGLPSLQTATYEIILDHGEGPLHLGLYTMVELVDDTGARSFFGSDDGNLYEGDGMGASLAAGHADQIVVSFGKKNNEEAADWGDIWALYEALHDEKRLTDPPAWQAQLEAVFDVDAFLGWLGIRGIVGHYDSYGAAPHNFFLYNNPKTGRLTWYSWDHNLTFMREVLQSMPLDIPGRGDAVPLISLLLEDPAYYARYRELLAKLYAGPAAPEAMIAAVRARAAVLAPHATRQMSAADYEAAVQELIDFIEQRSPQIAEFVGGPA